MNICYENIYVSSDILISEITNNKLKFNIKFRNVFYESKISSHNDDGNIMLKFAEFYYLCPFLGQREEAKKS